MGHISFYFIVLMSVLSKVLHSTFAQKYMEYHKIRLASFRSIPIKCVTNLYNYYQINDQSKGMVEILRTVVLHLHLHVNLDRFIRRNF